MLARLLAVLLLLDIAAERRAEAEDRHSGEAGERAIRVGNEATPTAVSDRAIDFGVQDAPCPKSTDDLPIESIERAVQRANQLRREDKDEEALRILRATYCQSSSPKVRAQMGLTEQALGRWVAAHDHLLQALAGRADPWVEKNENVLRQSVSAIEEHLGTLSVESNIDEAEIQLDGVAFGTAPLRRKLMPIGIFQLEVRARGFLSATRTVQVRTAEDHRETVQLEPTTSGQLPSGNESSPSPEPPQPKMQAAGHSTDSGQRVAQWSLFVGGTVLAIEGVIAQVVAQQRAAVYNDDSRCVWGNLSRNERCGAYRKDAQLARAVAIISYGLGGAALAGGIYFTLAQSKGSGHPAARVLIQGGSSLAHVNFDLEF